MEVSLPNSSSRLSQCDEVLSLSSENIQDTVEANKLPQISLPPSECSEENMKHENETDSDGKIVLTKQADKEGTDDRQIAPSFPVPMLALHQPTVHETSRLSIDSPSRLVTHGLKLNGEIYEAVSVDVQTDESWLLSASTHEFAQATQLVGANIESVTQIAPDLSSSEVIDSDDDAKEDLVVTAESESEQSALNSCSTSMSESDLTDHLPVIEINVEDSSCDEFEKALDSNLVKTVLPPLILQYRRESEESELDFAEIKPPSIEPLSDDKQDYYDDIIKEAKKRRRKRSNKSELININPHDAFSSKQERKQEKERLAAKSRAKEAEKKKQLDVQASNQANFYAFARQLKTINYSLSSDRCMEDGWTVRPESPPPPLDPGKEFFTQEPGTNIASGKRYQRSFMQKFYDNGKPFLSMFADGTGTVWYRTGNLAISIISTEKHGKLLYLVHEDKALDEKPQIQAHFAPDGYCTCYYPNGSIRTNLNPFGGEYYSLRGERIKRWQWRDKETHVHAPPFQPITFGLSKHVGVRIIAQESVFITFMDGRRSIRLNVGTKLRINTGSPAQAEMIDVNSILAQERLVYVQSLLQRFYYTFQYPHSPRRAQLKLPHFLNTKLEKISKLKSSLEPIEPIRESIASPPHRSKPLHRAPIPPIPRKPVARDGSKKISIADHKVECPFVVTVN